MGNIANVLLPLLAGAGKGVAAIADEKRRDAEQEARQHELRMRQALEQVSMDRDLRESGLRPKTDNDIGDAARRTLATLPGLSITPPAISVPAPKAAPLPTTGLPAGDQRGTDPRILDLVNGPKPMISPMKRFAQSPDGARGPGGRPLTWAEQEKRADQVQQQHIVQATFTSKPRQDTVVDQGTSLTAALHPRTVKDVYGNDREYVEDQSITPEARAMRELIRRADLERRNTIAVRDAEIATQQNQAQIDRDRRRDAYIAAGYTPQQAAVAAENPAMADNIFTAAHPRAESPSEVEYRRGLTNERQQRQREQQARYVADAADKFIEAANGDPNLAASFALQDAHGQTAISAGMGRADFQAAAQRYKDRFTAKSKANDDESSFVEALRGGSSAGSRGASPARAPSKSAASTAGSVSTPKRTISRDEAEYVKAARGWTDAQVAARFTVR